MRLIEHIFDHITNQPTNHFERNTALIGIRILVADLIKCCGHMIHGSARFATQKVPARRPSSIS